jgi:hypothetical protein
VTEGGDISVGSILVTYTPSSAEEEEIISEHFGTHDPGAPNEEGCFLDHPVNCATGNQVVTQTDLSVGGRGLGLNLTRTYNSLLAAHQTEHGAFGPTVLIFIFPKTLHSIRLRWCIRTMGVRPDSN